MALLAASVIWLTDIHLPPIGHQSHRVQQMRVTAAATANACRDPKNGIVKLIRGSNLFAALVVKNGADHSAEMLILPPQFHIQRAVPAMKQNRVVKTGTLLAFDRDQPMSCYQ